MIILSYNVRGLGRGVKWPGIRRMNDSERKKIWYAESFSHFSDEFGIKEFWRIFGRYGRVKEVFIAARRNQWGRRYGFVCFAGGNESKIA